MARLPRLHVPGGVYYVALRGNGGDNVFVDDTDYPEFGRLVSRSLRRCQARVHAFCWLPNAVFLAIQVTTVPVGRIIQRIASQHSRRVHRKTGRTGHLFEHAYRAVLVDVESYFVRLIRHVHRAPVRARLVSDPLHYPWSGHRAYLGLETVPWLTTSVVLRILAKDPAAAREAYRKIVAQSCNPDEVALFEQGSPSDPRVVGSAGFLRSLGLRPPPRRAVTLDQLIDAVIARLEVTREALLSPSRRRPLPLARAVIAWHATRNDVAPLAHVARRLNRDPSTLLVAIERYRALRPDLFTETMTELMRPAVVPWTVPKNLA